MDALTHELDKAEYIEQFVLTVITNGKGAEHLYAHLEILPFAIIFASLATAFLFLLRVYLRAFASSRINYTLQTTLHSHLQSLPYATFSRQKEGDLIQTCTRDVELLRRFMVMRMNQFSYTITMVIFCFIILFEINMRLAFVCFATIPFLFLYSFFMIRLVKYRYRKTDDAEGELVDNLNQNLNGARIVKAYCEEAHQITLFKEKLAFYGECYKKHTLASAFFYGSSDIFVFLARSLALLFAIYLAYEKQISSGTIFISFTFVNMMVWPLRDMATTLSNLGQTMASSDRIFALLNMEIEDIHAGIEVPIKGDIVFDDVSFAYPDAPEKLVLKHISFHISPGDNVAILGRTGSGKSTIFALLCRLFDNYEGHIYIDGKDIKEYSLHCIRSQLLPVLQDPFLFSMSLEENIEIASETPSEEEVLDAIETSGLKKTIESFQDGYATRVGEKGVTLSGGQRQRVAIARALLAHPPVLLLDDSLSAVDTETDKLIRGNLSKKKGETTCLQITHRIASAKDADLIIVLGKGFIEEIGTHEELSAGKGTYGRILRMQSRVKGELHG